MRITIPALLLAVALTGSGVYAQSAASAQQRFEVASIKPCRSSESPKGGVPTPGRLDLACVTTANLIRLAYLVFPTGEPNAPVSPNAFLMPIFGGPSWIDSARYRIDAETEERANIELMEGPMMQALLEERFQLKFHRETKPIDVFELTVAKTGPKLLLAKKGECIVFDRNHPLPAPDPGKPGPAFCGHVRDSPGGGYDIPGVTMADLCRQLSAYVDRDLVDKTNLKGVFDIHLDLAPADLGDPGAVPDPSSPFIPGDGGAIAVAVEKLGLHMRSAKASTQFLVIDHIERPSEN